MPLVYWRVKFAQEFGWTFDEFDRLPVGRFYETIGVLNGIAEATDR